MSSVTDLIQAVPAAYVLVFFRIAGMMIFAPLLGSNRIPRRVKVLLAAIMALGVCSTVTPPAILPATTWQLAVGIGGEMLFGLAMGMVLSMVFIATQWAGDMIGQQMGLNMSEVFDPQFGAHGSLIGDVYFMMSLVIFCVIGGHRAMIIGVRESFDALPLLSIGINEPVFHLIVNLFQACTVLSIQLAAPMMVTMLILDLALGFVGKTIPQMNLMTAGMSLRGAVGLIVLIFGIGMTNGVIRGQLLDAMQTVTDGWHGALKAPAAGGVS
jgi:flagellar biosynthetic protein FliR